MLQYAHPAVVPSVDKERHAENTVRISKCLDTVWTHFCPAKPCIPLSTDGNENIYEQKRKECIAYESE